MVFLKADLRSKPSPYREVMWSNRWSRLVAATAAVVLSGCANSSDVGQAAASQDGGPTEAVQQFLTAQQDRDCEPWADLFSERFLAASAFGSREGAVEDCRNAPPVGDRTQYEYLIEAIDGDTATVDVEWTTEHASAITTYELVQEDGQWLIDGY